MAGTGAGEAASATEGGPRRPGGDGEPQGRGGGRTGEARGGGRSAPNRGAAVFDCSTPAPSKRYQRGGGRARPLGREPPGTRGEDVLKP